VGSRSRKKKGVEKVREYHEALLGDEFELFESWLTKPLRKSLRLNTIKADKGWILKRLKEELGTGPGGFEEVEAIPWCDEGFWVPDRPWGATLLHQLGFIYIQEAASMLPVELLDVGENDVVLDLAAAPGSKTTQLAARCGTVVANEPADQRRKVLFSNLYRCGVSNCIVTAKNGQDFPDDVGFDKVLLDAPCSDIGVARKNSKVLRTWSKNRARSLAGLQKKLIARAFELLKPGGKLVYSTCTSTIEENEEVILALLEHEPGAKLVKPRTKAKSRGGLLEGAEDVLRVYPWDNDTGFFFVAKIMKKR